MHAHQIGTNVRKAGKSQSQRTMSDSFFDQKPLAVVPSRPEKGKTGDEKEGRSDLTLSLHSRLPPMLSDASQGLSSF